MIEANDLLDKINTEQIIDILKDLGHDDVPKNGKKGLVFRTSLCHGGLNYNLQYFEDTKDFYCYSECKKKHSIFDLVMKNKGCGFYDAVKYIAAKIGYIEDFHKTNKKESESWQFLQQFKKQRRSTLSEGKNQELPETVLGQYIINPVKAWVEDNIDYNTQQLFEVGVSIEDNRIIVPHRQWDTGKLVGVFGRTLVENYKELGVGKWMPLYDFDKNYNLFGFWQNRHDIFKKKQIILMESEKSPMKGRTLGINNICATSGKNISPTQIKILIRLGLEVVIAYDKNVNEDQLRRESDKLKYFLPVSIIDSSVCEDLGEKDAPIDKGREIFEQLYNNRVVIK